MHPLLVDGRRLAMYLVAWVPIGALLAMGLAPGIGWAAAAAQFLPLGLIYAFIGLSAWYLCRAFPLDQGIQLGRLLLVHTLAGAITSALWVAIGAAWAEALAQLPVEVRLNARFADRAAVLFVVGFLLFTLASAFHYVLIAFQTSREAETRALAQNLLAREAELKALRMQIDPHFLFNSLHSISALTATDPEGARRMCLLLADFLRDTLRLGSNTRISLGDEIALAERFLAIERVRLGARLQVATNTGDNAAGCLVPPLLLQPLVENAVVHGVSQLIDGGLVRIAATREGGLLVIRVDNPRDPDEPRRSRGVGLGLSLLRRRLATEFGGQSAVHISDQPAHFSVELQVPAVTAG
jgi:hypothetical protein